MTARRWSNIASFLTVLGGAAWIAKFAVIVASDGRIIDTGAAAWLLRLGLLCLALGATGFGVWFTRERHIGLRIAAILASPVAFIASFLLLDSLARAAVGTRGPAYLPLEAGILVTALLWLALGLWLLAATRRGTAGTPVRAQAV